MERTQKLGALPGPALMLGAVLLMALPAHAEDAPFGWGFCTDPAGGLALNRCTAHVLAACDAAADRAVCLAGHYDTWFRYDANQTVGDAVEKAAPSGRLSFKDLAEALDRVTSQPGTCGERDVECLLRGTIKRALGNHALRAATEN